MSSLIPTLFLLLPVAVLSAETVVYKCRQGERIVYQANPCPPVTQGQSRLSLDPGPDPASVTQARDQAEADIAAAAALRRREAREAAQRRAQEVAAERRALACTRRLEAARMLEAPAPGETQADRRMRQRLALQERKAYVRECGPLPR